jgi:hypothetical protein
MNMEIIFLVIISMLLGGGIVQQEHGGVYGLVFLVLINTIGMFSLIVIGHQMMAEILLLTISGILSGGAIAKIWYMIITKNKKYNKSQNNNIKPQQPVENNLNKEYLESANKKVRVEAVFFPTYKSQKKESALFRQDPKSKKQTKQFGNALWAVSFDAMVEKKYAHTQLQINRLIIWTTIKLFYLGWRLELDTLMRIAFNMLRAVPESEQKNISQKSASPHFRQDPENQKQDSRLLEAFKQVSKNPPETI